MVIVMSHLHYALDGEFLLFEMANKVGVSVISLYFFISGYGMMSTYKSAIAAGRDPFEGFIRKRIWGILKPFLLVLSIYLFWIYCEHGFLPPNMVHSLLMQGQTPLPNSWFIFVLLGLYIAFYIAFRDAKGEATTNALGCLAILIGGITIVPILLGYERAWWATTLAFISGVLYQKYERELFGLMGKWSVIILVLVFIILMKLLPGGYFIPLAFMLIPIVLVKILNASAYCEYIDKLYMPTTQRNTEWVSWSENKICILNKDPIIKGLLHFFSEISFELYLVHGVWIQVLRSSQIFIHNNHQYAVAVIFLSVLSAWLFHRLLNYSRKSQNS